VLILMLTSSSVVYSQKSEIGIMSLVGASNKYIKLPYVFQSVFYTLVSVVIANLILIPVVVFLYDDFMRILVGNLKIGNVSWLIITGGVLVQIIFGLLLSIVSTSFVLRRYLNK